MNARFIKTIDVLSIVKKKDDLAYTKKHVKKYVYNSSTACSCCKDIVVYIEGYILYTFLSNKELRSLGVKTNALEDYYGCY